MKNMLSSNQEPENDPTFEDKDRKSEVAVFENQPVDATDAPLESDAEGVLEAPAFAERRALIVKYASPMGEDFGGKEFASAPSIERWLEEHGYPREHEEFFGWTADSGGYGLHLPFVRYEGRRYYYLKMAAATAEDKTAMQKQLDTFQESVIAKIILPKPEL